MKRLETPEFDLQILECKQKLKQLPSKVVQTSEPVSRTPTHISKITLVKLSEMPSNSDLLHDGEKKLFSPRKLLGIQIRKSRRKRVPLIINVEERKLKVQPSQS